METASLLAIISGVCWATNITIVKWALNRSRASALVGATVGVTIAAIVSLILALISGSSSPRLRSPMEIRDRGNNRSRQFTRIIRVIDWFYRACRTSILIGTSPVFSVLLAVIFLDES